MTRAYWGTILSVDDSVGRLYELLRAAGQLDNTLIVFMGDNRPAERRARHGRQADDARAQHPHSAGGALSGPAAAGRAAVDRAHGLDRGRGPEHSGSVPGAAAGEHPGPVVEKAGPAGRSASGGSRSSTSTTTRSSFRTRPTFAACGPTIGNTSTTRTGDGGPDRHLAELYDLKHDPDERRNLIHDPAAAAKLKELQAELVRLMQEPGLTHDQMPLDEGIKQQLPDQKIR